MTLLESQYEDKEGNIYSALKLIEKSKDYQPFDLPLACVDTGRLPFALNDLEDFLFQMKRVEDTDLQYPIILDKYGVIADGWHRVAKAIYQGQTTIRAIRLEEMPPVDSINKSIS
jgi:disulfide oxidoreductase YuzD